MKYIKLGFYLLTAILTIVVISFMYFTSPETEVGSHQTGAGFGLTLAAILGGACALAWIGFGIIQLVDDTNKLKSAGIFVGALLVLFLIGYLTASGDIPTGELALKKFTDNGVTDAGTSRMIGALLNLPIILGAVAIVMIVVSEIKKAIS